MIQKLAIPIPTPCLVAIMSLLKCKLARPSSSPSNSEMAPLTEKGCRISSRVKLATQANSSLGFID